MIVLDTTVLVYAVGSEHPLRAPCRRLVDAVREERLAATTTVEVVQEFVHVRARRRGRVDAVALGREYVDLLAPLLVVTQADLSAGLAVYAGAEHLGAFDSVLAAAARTASADALVSADRAFAEAPGVRHVFPDDAGVDSLLRGETPP